MNNYTNVLYKKVKKKQLAIILAFMIFLSFSPWLVWGITEWNMRTISIVTLIISFSLINITSVKQNLYLSTIFLLGIIYLCFGGLSGYILPTHLQLTLYIFMLSFSRKFLINVLFIFEKIITIIFLLGIITYFISFLIKLPSFSIHPLNSGNTVNYEVYIFLLKRYDNELLGDSLRFFSVFDEPGVVGSLICLLISYKKLDFKNFRDVILIIAGLISFSLVFYIILVVNLIYNRTLNIKFYLIFIILIGGFYLAKPESVKLLLLDRFVNEDNTIGVVDNRSGSVFKYEYERFVNNGGSALYYGLGPEALIKLARTDELNMSTYKVLVYKYGIIGCFIFVFFFFYSTWKLAPTKRGWFFFGVFMLIAWQRPNIFVFFNIILYLSCLSYISYKPVARKHPINPPLEGYALS